MSRAIVYASRESDIKYWPDRHWEKMFLYNTTFERDGVNDIDAEALERIVVEAHLCCQPLGVERPTLDVGTAGQQRAVTAEGRQVLQVALGGELDCLINIDGFNEASLSYWDNFRKGVYPFYPANWYFLSQDFAAVDFQHLVGKVIFTRNLRARWARLTSSSSSSAWLLLSVSGRFA